MRMTGYGPPGHGGDALHGQARRHGDQKEPVRPGGKNGGDFREQALHHLRLDAQKDVFAVPGGLVDRGGGAAQLAGQDLRFAGSAVGEQELLRGEGPGGGAGQGAAHIAGADEGKSVGRHMRTSWIVV